MGIADGLLCVLLAWAGQLGMNSGEPTGKCIDARCKQSNQPNKMLIVGC